MKNVYEVMVKFFNAEEAKHEVRATTSVFAVLEVVSNHLSGSTLNIESIKVNRIK